MISNLAPLTYADVLEKIHDRTARVGVIGLGYVGLPLVLLFSEQGYRVTGFDVDTRKVEMLNHGGSYIYRISGDEVQAASQKGFQATSDYSQIDSMDAIIVCVPTPLGEHLEPDVSYIVSTMRSIAPHLRAGQLVVLESTTYPGTTEEAVVPILESGNKHGLHADRTGEDLEEVFYVAFSPEREDPGNDTVARRNIPKVVGGLSSTATQLTSSLYSSIFDRTVPVSTPAVAEMTKLLENIYRCVNWAGRYWRWHPTRRALCREAPRQSGCTDRASRNSAHAPRSQAETARYHGLSSHARRPGSAGL